jgi:putative ABC transport system permease protein
MTDLLPDLRYAVRSLLRRPGFTAVAVATLALGIGANTAIFSVIHGLLLEPPPYAEPERLVMVQETNRGELTQVAVANFVDLDREAGSYDGLAAYRWTSFNIAGGGERPERVEAGLATPDLFTALGVEPAHGRALSPQTDLAGGTPPREVVLGPGLWQRRFASDPDVLGSTLRLDGEVFTIVGVLAEPLFLPQATEVELWVPLAVYARDEGRGTHSNLAMVGRLAPGVPLAAARQEAAAVYARLAEEHPGTNVDVSAVVAPLAERLVEDVRPAALVLWAAVGFVLLIACANLANLMLTRAAGRHRELAVRRALGAGRGRLVRQLLTESCVLGLAGGAAGLLLGAWGLELLRAALPPGPRTERLAIDPTVLVFTLGLALATGLVIGLVPAWTASRRAAASGLAEGGRGGGPDRGGRRLRQLLVAAEVAMALVLLIGAGLMIDSFRKLRQVDPGFATGHLLVADLLLPGGDYDSDAKRLAFYSRLRERLAARPGVAGVTLASPLPLTDSSSASSFAVEGRSYGYGENPSIRWSKVAPGYFEVMGVPVRAGRGFDERDEPGAPEVIVIDTLTAERQWPGEDAVGKRIRFTWQEGSWLTVVGVVAPVHHLELDQPPQPHVYLPLPQYPPGGAHLVVATEGEPLALADAVREEVAALDPELPLGDVATMEEQRRGGMSRYWYPMLILGLFAALALALAALGIYGVMSYAVAQRTREIGVRMALGAAREQVVRMVLSEGARVVLAGAVAGLAAGLALARLMAGLLYEVTPGDPLSLTLVTLVLTAVALAACLLPARRAASVEPMEALRWE